MAVRIHGAAWLVGLAWMACSCAVGGHGGAPVSSPESEWRRQFPGAAALLGEAEGAPVKAPEGWRLRGAARRPAGSVLAEAPLEVLAPDTAEGTIRLRIPGSELAVGVRRSGGGSLPGRAEGAAIRYEGAGLDSLVFARRGGLEDLVLVRDRGAHLRYEFELPGGWSLAPGALADEVEVRNGRGLAALRLSAPICWAAGGESRALSLRIEGPRVEVLASDGVEGAPLGSCQVVDPGFSVSGVLPSPITDQVAVLLPSGKVLIAGGQDTNNTPVATLSLYDPWSGLVGEACADGPCVMSVPRAQFTGTLLRDGRVLLAGGFRDCLLKQSPADIYDSLTRQVVAGPAERCKIRHTSHLLPDGRVLLAGGRPYGLGAVDQVDFFDPASNSFSPGGHLLGPRASHASVLLASGKIVLAGGLVDNNNSALSSAELFDPATGGSSALGSLSEARNLPSATLLENGNVLVAGGFSPQSDDLSSMELLLSGETDFQPTPGLKYPRAGHTATLLPSGYVMLAGGVDGFKGQSSAEARESGEGLVSSLGDTALLRNLGATSTVLPTGEVLIAGGRAAQSELFSEAPLPGTTTVMGSPAPQDVRLVPLLNGQIVRVRSADLTDATATYPVEQFDPVLVNSASGPPFPLALGDAPGTTLGDGRVLFQGGHSYKETKPGSFDIHLTEQALLYDPQLNTLTPTGSLADKREPTAATLLLDGRVLVVGGMVETTFTVNGKEYTSQDTVATAEIFDPAAGTFAKTGSMAHVRRFHTATRLATGDVLVAGGTPLLISGDPTAELYHVKGGTFSLTGSMKQSRRSHASVLLGDGSVLVLGGASDGQFIASVERYDPAAGTFATAGQLNRARSDLSATLLPSGEVLVAGGSTKAANGGPFVLDIELFDPRTGTSATVGQLNSGRAGHSAALLPTGEVLLAGGGPAQDEIFAPQLFRNQLRPTLTTVPSPLAGGVDAALTGADLEGFSEAGTGTSVGGTSRVPVAIWMPFGGGLVSGGVRSWTATTATYRPPATSLNGPGWLFVVTTGVPAVARGLVVGRGVAGAPCSSDSACEGGFCVDGVCCASVCDGACEACSAAKKGSGEDGACGPVPAQSNPKGLCVEQGGCGTKAYCDDKGKCAQAPVGQECASPKCINGVFTPAPACNAEGKCVPSMMSQPCFPGLCAAADGACTLSCLVDQDCDPGAFCKDGSCQAPGGVGAACSSGAQCNKSTFCVDGVCCNAPCDGTCQACSVAKGADKDGLCVPLKAQTDPEDECPAEPPSTCGKTGFCDGQKPACALWDQATVCQDAICQQGTDSKSSTLIGQLCDGFGACQKGTVSCGLFLCDSAPVACKKACTHSSDCRADAYCDETGQCQIKRDLGAACSDAGGSCQSTHCVDGVCCDSLCDTVCRACSAAKTGGKDGTCKEVKEGTDPDEECVTEPVASCGRTGVCSGQSDCARWPADAVSKAPTCVQGTGTDESRIVAHVCDGFGQSQDEPSSCGSFRCDPALGACKSSCTQDSDCRGDAFCNAGQCTPKSDLSQACSDKKSCLSGYCFDGVCCDAPCDDSCQACNLPGKVGSCTATASPRADHKPCAAPEDPKCSGFCDGVQFSCQYPSEATTCGSPSCVGGRQGLAKTKSCSGKGLCVENPDASCLPFACAATACGDHCDRDEECAVGYACDAGQCQPLRQNSCDADGTTSVSIDHVRQDCRPFRCGATGVCIARCETSGDCADGARCDSLARCVAIASAEPGDDAGCGCRQAPATENPLAGLFSSLLVAAAASRRRRLRPC